MIKLVTITGADDSIKPISLAILSAEFPFVEWGILISKNNYGRPRFPSLSWLLALRGIKYDVPSIKLSAHLCGTYVRKFVEGHPEAIDALGPIWKIFDRVQLNFHAIPHEHTDSLSEIIKANPDKEFIFQHDGVNDSMIYKVAEKVPRSTVQVSTLFDKSGGRGLLPDQWPAPLPGIYSGYAGGLGPDNLKEQMNVIKHRVANRDTWVDMETRVRSDDDRQFDLDKVRACLEIAKEHLKQ